MTTKLQLAAQVLLTQLTETADGPTEAKLKLIQETLKMITASAVNDLKLFIPSEALKQNPIILQEYGLKFNWKSKKFN